MRLSGKHRIMPCFLAALLLTVTGCSFQTDEGIEEFDAGVMAKFLTGTKGEIAMAEVPKPDNASLITAYMAYIENNPGMSDKAKEELRKVLEHENALEDKDLQTKADAILEWEAARIAANYKIINGSNSENGSDDIKGLKAYVADAIFELRRKMTEDLDKYDEYALSLSEHDKAYIDSKNEYDFLSAQSFSSQEEEKNYLADTEIKKKHSLYAKCSGMSLTDLTNTVNAEETEEEPYTLNQHITQWVLNANAKIYGNSKNIVKEMKKLRDENYIKNLKNSMELFAFYLFLDDDGRCPNHLSAYHGSEGLVAFHNNEFLEESFRNKLASYGGDKDWTRYEDENIVNFIRYSKIGSNNMPEIEKAQKEVVENIGDPVLYYDMIYHWLGVRLAAEADDTGILDSANPSDSEIQSAIIRSAMCLLPPAYFYLPGYTTRYVTIEGCEGLRSKDVAANYEGYTSWNQVEDFYRGKSPEFTEAWKNGIVPPEAAGELTVLFRINTNYWYSVLRGLFNSRIYNMDTTDVYEKFFEKKWSNLQLKNPAVKAPDKFCTEHLTSYHTIEPTLIEYIEEKGRSFNEFFKADMDIEDYTIIKFVEKYSIPREDFEALFPPEEREFQPYNINAVYGPLSDAEDYFTLGHTPGFPVKYDLNGVEGIPPASRSAKEGVTFTIAADAKALGRNFIEWNTERSGGGDSFNPFELVPMPGGGIAGGTLYAIWETIPYTVDFDYGLEGIEPVHMSGLVYGESVRTPAAPPYDMFPEGSHAFYWRTSSKWLNRNNVTQKEYEDMGITAYYKGEKPKESGVLPYNYSLKMPPADVEFEGVFTYYVTYDVNGGVNADGKLKSSEIYLPGETVIFQNHAHAKRDGNPAKYWNTEPDGSGTTYYGNRYITMPDGPLTLYAIY